MEVQYHVLSWLRPTTAPFDRETLKHQGVFTSHQLALAEVVNHWDEARVYRIATDPYQGWTPFITEKPIMGV